jgi:hypothetical protein
MNGRLVDRPPLLVQGIWRFSELPCHPPKTSLTALLVGNDFEIFTILGHGFNLKELIHNFNRNSTPESEDRYRIHSIMFTLQPLRRILWDHTNK